ncbi:MAG TPA: hypothetical protein ENK65_02570 [Helicobacteraceae bacterium]|nr:hypothetical protein [Helicobacteraceae bacterium]
MRFVFLIVPLIVLFSACQEKPSYQILYPIEASKQKVLRLDGFRFLSSEHKSPISIMVLSNPIAAGSFVEAVFSYTNNSNTIMQIHPNDITIKMRNYGMLQLLTKHEYDTAVPYQKIAAITNLTPKMKSYGCAPDATQNNITVESMNPSQKQIWQEHLEYPFEKSALYLDTLSIKPQETKTALIRFKLPQTAADFDQSIILIKFSLADKQRHHFKFVLQSLD